MGDINMDNLDEFNVEVFEKGIYIGKTDIDKVLIENEVNVQSAK